MNYKVSTTSIIVQSIICYTLAVRPINVIDQNYDQFDCDSILSSMNFLNTQRCVQFIIGNEFHSVKCIKKIMENSENVTFYMRSVGWLMNRNMYVEESSFDLLKKKSTKFCENFIFALKNVSSLQTLLNAVKNNVSFVTFAPFTKMYFLFLDQNVQFQPSRTITEITKFFFANAQFGYAYELNAVSGKMKLRNLLSLSIESHPKMQTNLVHPIVNRGNNQNGMRLGFFNCSPYVIYIDEENFRFDGIEYRLVREVMRNWNVTHILQDESKTSISPWIKMFDDLENHKADLSMCSIWVSVFKDQYDVSSHYNHACNTLIVPMPKRLSEITAIYTTFSGEVWLAFGMLFLATGLLLWTSAMIGIVRRTVYVHLSRSLLEIMNVATSHGVELLQTQKTSIKILLMSWIIGCLSIGICYVTIYNSRLSKPGYTKVIHTVEDFIESDMWWGSDNTRAYGDLHASLEASSNAAHHELNRRIVAFKNHDDAEAGWLSGKFGVFAGVANQKYLVLYEWNEQLQSLSTFRVMRKACIFNYYTVFALQKFSPYKELFSHYALQFQEHGITQYWFMTVYRDRSWTHKYFDDHPKENNEPEALRFASIIGALLVLFVSHILSFIVFICELSTRHRTCISKVDDCRDDHF